MSSLPKVFVQVASDVDIPASAASMRRWARAALSSVGRSGDVCIRLVDVAEMTDLNSRFRDKHGATNVLSFAADSGAHVDGENLLGDIAICVPVVAAEAAAQGKRPEDHLAHLVVHGVLHLCGCDHEIAADAQVMEGREVAILTALGIADPYR